MVEERVLPVSMVLGIFPMPARNTPYPFPYFQQALRIRAEKEFELSSKRTWASYCYTDGMPQLGVLMECGVNHEDAY